MQLGFTAPKEISADLCIFFVYLTYNLCSTEFEKKKTPNRDLRESVMILLSSVAKTGIRFFNQKLSSLSVGEQVQTITAAPQSSGFSTMESSSLTARFIMVRTTQRGNVSRPLVVGRSTRPKHPCPSNFRRGTAKTEHAEFRTAHSMLQNTLTCFITHMASPTSAAGSLRFHDKNLAHPSCQAPIQSISSQPWH